MILLKKAFRALWLFTLSQIQTAIARQQRVKALPAGKPMPALGWKPEETAIVLPALSATEKESLRVAEQVSASMIPAVQSDLPAAELPQSVAVTFCLPKPEQMPYLDRAAVVMALLDEAHSRGLTTYNQMIDYVKQQTGEGCSRRAIAQWKKGRGLMEAA